MMKKATLLSLAACTVLVTACQTTSQPFNGKIGYKVEQSSSTNAVLTYTLANDRNPAKEAQKLQHACQQTLGANKNYQIKILDTQEIATPANIVSTDNIKIGTTNTTFGFSNTPHLNSNQEGYAARQIEETHPQTLKIVRFSCA